jgi:hypothetical protein
MVWLIGLLALGLVALAWHAHRRHVSLRQDVDDLFQGTRKRLRALEDKIDDVDARSTAGVKKTPSKGLRAK